MATYVSGSATATSAGSASVTVNAPASIVAGNLLVAVWYAGATAGFAFGAQAGWTTAGSNTAIGANTQMCVLYKTASGSEPSTYTFTGTASGLPAAAVLQYSGAGNLATLAFGGQSTTTTTATAPTITAGGTGSWMACYASARGKTFSPPSGFTPRDNALVATDDSIYTFEKAVSSGATGTATSTIGAASEYGSVSFLIPDAAPTIVTGSAAVALGPLTVTATSVDIDTATASVALGPLTVTGSSSRVYMGGSCTRAAWLTLGSVAVSLEDPTKGYFCQQLDLGTPASRDVLSNRPDRDGVDDRTQYMGSRVVTASITALAGAGARIDAVAALFAPFTVPSARPTLHYVLDRPGTPERTMGLRGLAYAWPIAGANQRDLQLQWVAADPVAYNPVPQTVTATVAVNATLAPLGDVPARPRFRIAGPITAPSLVITPATGFAWQLTFLPSFTVAAGHFVDVDTNARTVYYDANPALPRLAALDWTVSSWQWIPAAPSTSTMDLNGTATSGATTVTATWGDGYLT